MKTVLYRTVFFQYNCNHIYKVKFYCILKKLNEVML